MRRLERIAPHAQNEDALKYVPAQLQVKTFQECEPFIEELRESHRLISPVSLAKALGVRAIDVCESACRDQTGNILGAMSEDSFRNYIVQYERLRNAWLSLRLGDKKDQNITRKDLAEALGMKPQQLTNAGYFNAEFVDVFGIHAEPWVVRPRRK